MLPLFTYLAKQLCLLCVTWKVICKKHEEATKTQEEMASIRAAAASLVKLADQRSLAVQQEAC